MRANRDYIRVNIFPTSRLSKIAEDGLALPANEAIVLLDDGDGAERVARQVIRALVRERGRGVRNSGVVEKWARS